MSRAFVIAWLCLTVAGALHVDLGLPHLKYGHVMFNRNAKKAQLFYYSGADGVRHDLADLVVTPALGYRRARLAITYAVQPDYLLELCLQARRAGRAPLTFTVEEVDADGTTARDVRCHR